MKLTIEQNQYFDAMDAMFMSEAWRLFQDDVQGWKDALRDQLEGAKDLRELGVIQGRMNMAQQIRTYQSVVEGAKKSLEDAPDEVVDNDAPTL